MTRARKIFKKTLIAKAAALAALGCSGAVAADYKIGDFDLTVNSTVSFGTSYRVENRDPFLYGTNNRDSSGAAGRGGANTSDDGNLNFDSGDAFTTVFKGLHEFELKRENYGFFSRVRWFYDHTLNNEEVFHGHEPNGNATNQKLNDGGFHPYARFDGIDLLDAYGYLDTKFGETPATIRLGKQVIGWGESFFLFSPIAGLNAIDVSSLRRPGAELKEGFTPSEMLYTNIGLSDSTSLEAFYQLKWRKSVPEGCGTYFSTNDFAADGCSRLAFAGSLGGPGDAAQLATPDTTVPRFNPVTRQQDNQPKDDGQFGLAVRNYFNSIGTEVGAYFLNYHSRIPQVGLRKGVAAFALTPNGADQGNYFIDYPEDISVLGLSFSTNVAGWAWAGEVSQAFDVPVALNANDLLVAGLFGAAANPGGPIGGANGAGSTTLNNRAQATPANGGILNGYDKFDITQIQTSLIKSFDRALGSNSIVLVSELGAVFVDDLPDQNVIRYGRNPVFGAYNRNNNGYTTDFSWGYRMRATGTYRDAVGSVDLIPSVSWAHDVEGYSPEPGQIFNEGRQTIGLTLGLEFDANTKAAISYTKFNNAADFDPLRDRDFVSVTASYSF